MMPSPRAFVAYVGLLSIGLLQFSSASPVHHQRCGGSTPTLPSIPGASALPQPDVNTALKYVVIGRGTQNYTCTGPSAVPVAIGATAKLYDFTQLAYDSLSKLHRVPPAAAHLSLNEIAAIENYDFFPVIGQHYFLADGTPTFNLSAVQMILYAKKLASVNAPADADAGPDGTGAVPWLALGDNGGSIGVKHVYRVETAGGRAPALCTLAGVLTIQYAAEYWFYGC